MPAAPPNATSNLGRTTTHSERCHTTPRQRVSHLVRETLACSKNLADQIGASPYVIGHSNLTRAAA
jgi:hypothetical protein